MDSMRRKLVGKRMMITSLRAENDDLKKTLSYMYIKRNNSSQESQDSGSSHAPHMNNSHGNSCDARSSTQVVRKLVRSNNIVSGNNVQQIQNQHVQNDYQVQVQNTKCQEQLTHPPQKHSQVQQIEPMPVYSQAQNLRAQSSVQKQNQQAPSADLDEIESFLHTIENQLQSTQGMENSHQNSETEVQVMCVASVRKVQPSSQNQNALPQSTQSCLVDQQHKVHKPELSKQSHNSFNLNAQGSHQSVLEAFQNPQSLANAHNNPNWSLQVPHHSPQQNFAHMPQNARNVNAPQHSPQNLYERSRNPEQANFDNKVHPSRPSPQSKNVNAPQHSSQNHYERSHNPEQANLDNIVHPSRLSPQSVTQRFCNPQQMHNTTQRNVNPPQVSPLRHLLGMQYSHQNFNTVHHFPSQQYSHQQPSQVPNNTQITSTYMHNTNQQHLQRQQISQLQLGQQSVNPQPVQGIIPGNQSNPAQFARHQSNQAPLPCPNTSVTRPQVNQSCLPNHAQLSRPPANQASLRAAQPNMGQFPRPQASPTQLHRSQSNQASAQIHQVNQAQPITAQTNQVFMQRQHGGLPRPQTNHSQVVAPQVYKAQLAGSQSNETSLVRPPANQASLQRPQGQLPGVPSHQAALSIPQANQAQLPASHGGQAQLPRPSPPSHHAQVLGPQTSQAQMPGSMSYQGRLPGPRPSLPMQTFPRPQQAGPSHNNVRPPPPLFRAPSLIGQRHQQPSILTSQKSHVVTNTSNQESEPVPNINVLQSQGSSGIGNASTSKSNYRIDCQDQNISAPRNCQSTLDSCSQNKDNSGYGESSVAHQKINAVKCYEDQSKSVGEVDKQSSTISEGPFATIVKEEKSNDYPETSEEKIHSWSNTGKERNIEDSLGVSEFFDLENIPCAPVPKISHRPENVSGLERRRSYREPSSERRIDIPPQAIITPPQTPPTPIPSTSGRVSSPGLTNHAPYIVKSLGNQTCIHAVAVSECPCCNVELNTIGRVASPNIFQEKDHISDSQAVSRSVCQRNVSQKSSSNPVSVDLPADKSLSGNNHSVCEKTLSELKVESPHRKINIETKGTCNKKSSYTKLVSSDAEVSSEGPEKVTTLSEPPNDSSQVQHAFLSGSNKEQKQVELSCSENVTIKEETVSYPESSPLNRSRTSSVDLTMSDSETYECDSLKDVSVESPEVHNRLSETLKKEITHHDYEMEPVRSEMSEESDCLLLDNSLAELDCCVEYVHISDNLGKCEIKESKASLSDGSETDYYEEESEIQSMEVDGDSDTEDYSGKTEMQPLEKNRETSNVEVINVATKDDGILRIYISLDEEGRTENPKEIPECCPLCYTAICPSKITVNTETFDMKTVCTGCELTICLIWGTCPNADLNTEFPGPKSQKRRLNNVVR